MSDVPEAPLEETADGLVPAGPGWFVLNAREARWRERPGRGVVLSFTGTTDAEREWFPIVGAGAGCVVLGVGSREYQEGDAWGGYTVADVALRHGVGVEQETSDPAVAYARFGPGRPVPYREGSLPE
jgi:hypothetical protein